MEFDPLHWRPWSATRSVIGVGVPLVAAGLTGHIAEGILASTGALYAGFNSFRGTYPMRLRSMAITTTIMSVMTLLGSFLSPHPAIATVSIGIVAFSLALFSASSRAALLISIQGTALFVVLAGIQATAKNPLGNAGVVLAGGVFQMLLLSVIWPFNPRYPERRAVDRVYVSLARFVKGLRSGTNGAIPDAELLAEARDMLAGLDPQPQEILYALRVAETIRAGLVGLARADEETRKLGASAARRVDAVSIRIERALLKTAVALRHHRPFTASVKITPSRWTEHDRWARVVADAISRLQNPPQEIAPVISEGEPFRVQDLFSSTTLRALSVQHAFRYGVGVATAFGLSRLWGEPHAYWLPLSTCILLRADYATTLSRGFARLTGTLVGVAIATGIASLGLSPVALTVLILAATWLGCSMYLANYTLFTMAITCFAVFSVAATEITEKAAAQERLLATLGGAGMAVLANFVWPIWQSRKVDRVLRDAIESQAIYGEKVHALFSGAAPAEVDRARHRARTLRLEAERVVQGASIEPVWGRKHLPTRTEQIVEGIDENAAILLTLHANALQERLENCPVDPTAPARTTEALADTRALLGLFESSPDVGAISGRALRPDP